MSMTAQRAIVPKIDMHVHPQFPGGPERLRGGTWPAPGEVQSAYKRLNIEKGIIMSCSAPEHMHDPITSRVAESIFNMYPETFAGWFCAMDPRLLNLFSHCEKCNMPVTIHFGRLGGVCGVADDLGLPRLEKVLASFPKLRILGHAMAFWSEISADISSPQTIGQTAVNLCAFLDQGYQDGNISSAAYRAICRENALALLTEVSP